MTAEHSISQGGYPRRRETMAEKTDTCTFTKDDAVRDVFREVGVVCIGLVLEMGLAFTAQRFAMIYLSIDKFGNLIYVPPRRVPRCALRGTWMKRV